MIYAELKTSVSLALFPALLGDVSVLYDLLSARLRRAVFSGNLTHTIRRLSISIGSAATSNALLTNVTIGAMQEVSINYQPSNTAAKSSSSSAVDSSVLPVMVSVAVIGVLVFALVLYYLRRYFKKSSAKYKNAMEITGLGADTLPHNAEHYHIDEIDLDKLNYIADVSEVQR
jgi:hypothetical protein